MSGGGECGYKFVLTPVSALDIKKMFDVREARIPLFPSFLFFESDFYTLFRPSFFPKIKKNLHLLCAPPPSPLSRARTSAPRFYVYLFIHLFIKE